MSKEAAAAAATNPCFNDDRPTCGVHRQRDRQQGEVNDDGESATAAAVSARSVGR